MPTLLNRVEGDTLATCQEKGASLRCLHLSLIRRCNPSSTTAIDVSWKCLFWQFYIHSLFRLECVHEWNRLLMYWFKSCLKVMGCLARAATAASRLKRFVKLITKHHVILPHSGFDIYWAVHEWTNTDYSGLMDLHWLHIKVRKTWNYGKVQRPTKSIIFSCLIINF